MKKFIFTILFSVALLQFSFAQNTFPLSGNVGIGTTNTAGLLTLNDITYPAAWFLLNNQVKFQLAVAGGAGYWAPTSQTGDIVFRSSSTNMLFSTNSGASTMLALTPSGNVGIGTTTPTDRLVVNGNIKAILDPSVFSNQNIAGFISLGYSGITGARNWAVRGVYQYANGVGQNAVGGDLDLIKSQDSNTILGTKSDGTPLGNVLIGRTNQLNASYMLDVAGPAHATSIVVNSGGADFVFAPKYHLNSLPWLSKYIAQNHHLPEIPSAKQMQADGLNVGDNQVKLLQKVEELTLYLIEKDKEIRKQSQQLKAQQKQIDLLINKSYKHKNKIK